MNLFRKIIKKREREENNQKSMIRWIPLTALSQIATLKEASKATPVVIFKHSTRCGISNMVLKQFEKSFDEELSTLKVYYLDLLNYRPISDEVGYTFQVLHQSPQLIVVKDEKMVANASHYDILQINLKSFLK